MGVAVDEYPVSVLKRNFHFFSLFRMLKQSVDTFRIQYMNKIEDIEEAKQNILSQTKRCETLKEVLEELNSRKVKQDMDMKEALSAAEK